MFDETPLWMVEDEATLRRMAERLAGAPAIGVDTESDSFHHYQEKVCLIQFSDLETDYVVDPLAVPDLSPLEPVFADPNIVKIFHGADYDIVCLKRDFGFEIRNVFDTMISAQMLGLERVGLADLINEFFGLELEKKYQRHDWAERPLRPEHVEYARGDTHWLCALREILARRLEKRGRLDRVIEECRLLEKREWEGRSFDPDGYLRIKQSHTLDDAGKRILRRLYLYRDEQARKLDRPPFKVIPDPVLVDIAARKPKDETELDRIVAPRSALRRRHTHGFLDSVGRGVLDDFPIPKPKPRGRRESGPPARLTGRAAERALEALKNWRNELCERNQNLAPVAVVSNATLKSIVRVYPETVEELANVGDVRQWQVEAYGRDILEVLHAAVPIEQVRSGQTAGEGDEDDDGEPKKRRRRRRRR